MTVAVWRIAAEVPAYSANDMTGTGARLTGGRWNSVGRPMVYCASTVALAALESMAAMSTGALPYNRFLVRLDVPDTAWAAHETLAPPAGWDAIPEGRASIKAGDAWAASLRSLILRVPSVIIPEEFNVLLNPLHPDIELINATTIRKWIYDPRFR